MSKKVNVPLLEDYNPRLMRTKIRHQYQERFFKLFCSLFDFGGSVSEEERIIILKLLWENGSFLVSRSPSPVKAFEKEMDLTFMPYAVEDYDFYIQPLHVRNAPKKAAKAVSKKILQVGKDAVIVYLNETARIRPKCGAMKTADRYISQIVNAKMTIQTNILLHKVPYIVPVDEDDHDLWSEIMRQIFSDVPAVFVPKSIESKDLQSLQLSIPYIIDKLESYCVRLENMFLDEIGIDNAKPVQSGQDRLLMDETNANNSLINNFRDSIFDNLQAGFDDVETIFDRKISVEPRAQASYSVHEEINGKAEDDDPEDPKDPKQTKEA